MKRSVILASALFMAAPAHAYPTMFGGDCDTPQGCLIGLPEDANDLYVGFDWTIPDDGVTYKWTFTVDQPGATVYVPGGNQVEYFRSVKTAAGISDEFSRGQLSLPLRPVPQGWIERHHLFRPCAEGKALHLRNRGHRRSLLPLLPRLEQRAGFPMGRHQRSVQHAHRGAGGS